MDSKVNSKPAPKLKGKYKGNLNKNNIPEGRGHMTYPDGSIFHGFFINGLRDGNGVMTFPSGNRYNGQYKNDKREGYGEFFYLKENEKYVGYWHQDIREGRGEYRFKDGSVFIGNFKNGLKHGVGKKVSKKMEYKGKWERGLKHGIFKFTLLSTNEVSMVKYVAGKRVKIQQRIKNKNIKSSNSFQKNPNNVLGKREFEDNIENNKANCNQYQNTKIDLSADLVLNASFSKPNKIISKKRIKNRTSPFLKTNSISSLNSNYHLPVRNCNLNRILSSIHEVPENKLSITTYEHKQKLLNNFDKQSDSSKNCEIKSFIDMSLDRKPKKF